MLRYWAIVLFLFVHLIGFAQSDRSDFNSDIDDDDGKSGFIGASYGITFPYGFLKNNDLSNDLSGYANRGYSYKINFGYDMTPYAGYTCRFIWIHNSVNEVAFKKVFDSQGLFTNANTKISDITFSTNWHSGGFMAGGYGKLTANKFIFDITGVVGFLKYRTPYTNVFINDNTTPENIEVNEIFSLTGAAGLNIKYKIKNILILNLNTELLYSEPMFLNYDGFKNSIINQLNNVQTGARKQPYLNLINSFGIYLILN